MKIPE
jgi:hypothetical protein